MRNDRVLFFALTTPTKQVQWALFCFLEPAQKIFLKMSTVIDLYRYGIKENPWDTLDVNELKTTKEDFQKRVKGQDFGKDNVTRFYLDDEPISEKT